MIPKIIKRFYKIYWLRRCQAIYPHFFQDIDESEAVAKSVLEKLDQFNYFYILYFLADILYSLAMLPKVFQLKFVDITTVDSIVRTEVVQICMMFIVNSCNLNADVFNNFTAFHVLSDYGPHSGYLKRLQSEIRGSMFHSFHMTWSKLGTDLEKTLIFQK